MCSVQHLSPASLLLHYSTGIYRTFQAGAFVVWKRGLAHSELPILRSGSSTLSVCCRTRVRKVFSLSAKADAYCILVVNEFSSIEVKLDESEARCK